MGKGRRILEPVVFLILCVVVICLIGIFKQDALDYYRFLPILIIEWALYFILGVLLNCVNRKFNFHVRRFSPFHLTVMLVCILLVVVYYVFSASMPNFITSNFGFIEIILLSYAGANLPSVFFE